MSIKTVESFPLSTPLAKPLHPNSNVSSMPTSSRLAVENLINNTYKLEDMPGPLCSLLPDQKLRVDANLSEVNKRVFTNRNRNWLSRLMMAALPRSLGVACGNGDEGSGSDGLRFVSKLSKSSSDSKRNDNSLSANQRGEICLKAILVLTDFWRAHGKSDQELFDEMASDDIQKRASRLLLETCSSICQYEMDAPLAEAVHPDDFDTLVPYLKIIDNYGKRGQAAGENDDDGARSVHSNGQT